MGEYITVNEIAKNLHLSKTTVYKLLEVKGCPKLKIGNKYIVKAEAFQKFLDEYNGSQIII